MNSHLKNQNEKIGHAARENAGTAAFGGVILLILGSFFRIGFHAGHGPIYAFLIDLFNWSVPAAGALMLAAAALCFLGSRYGLILDAATSGVTGLILVACGVGWTVFEGKLDVYTVVVLLLAVMLLRESYSTGMNFWGHMPRSAGGKRVVEAMAPAPPVRINSSVLPKDGEPAPEEGYLAALARERDED
ncbi:MAG TPA: hypothetical protein VNT79_17390 [Phycisphaerae bacterium]|nr:hypothetical protein [Phycisphaerae bacterium]